LGVSGCRTGGFYAQAAKGQYQLLAHRKAVEKLVADPETPATLKHQLELVLALRGFAERELKLPVDGHYRKYVDVGRRYVVWNVEAAPEFSMEPRTWWYPLVGSLAYRGYFSEQGATNYAAAMRRKGYDVFVPGVEAYSTLGWFKDPVLNTFVFQPEPDLAEVIFHELAHQEVFASGDTDFNEAFATAVGQEGTRRWLKAKGDLTTYEAYLAELQRTREFATLVMTTRLELESLYGDERAEGKVKATQRERQTPREALRREKAQILKRLRERYEALKKSWGGVDHYDHWFAQDLNNAQLNSVAAYYDLVPGFERLLAVNAGDFGQFYVAAKELAHKSRAQRHKDLHALGESQLAPTRASGH
jgi:predicted aminopeptidase